MSKRKHAAEESINKFREAEVIIGSGSTVFEANRRIGVSEQTFYLWQTDYGGSTLTWAGAQTVEDGEQPVQESGGQLTLDNRILKEAAEGNF